MRPKRLPSSVSVTADIRAKPYAFSSHSAVTTEVQIATPARTRKTSAFVLFSTWDSERDASEFETAYNTVVQRKHPLTQSDVRVERQGLDVLVVESSFDLDGRFNYLGKVRNPPAIPQPDPDLSAALFDFDGNLEIGFGDFLLFAAAFGQRESDLGFDATFDTKADGMVGFTDFINFASVFGQAVEAAGKPVGPHLLTPVW